MFESHRAHPHDSGTFFFAHFFKDLMSVPNKRYISGKLLFSTIFLWEILPFGILSQGELAIFNKNLNSLIDGIFFKIMVFWQKYTQSLFQVLLPALLLLSGNRASRDKA